MDARSEVLERGFQAPKSQLMVPANAQLIGWFFLEGPFRVAKISFYASKRGHFVGHRFVMSIT
jgi:hypothetical protein